MVDTQDWLIFGGSGQLGKSLRDTLAKNNIRYHSPTSRDCDIRNLEVTRNIISRVNPGVIVNCAGWTNVRLAEEYPQETYELNVLAATNIALASKNHNTKFIQISTDYVFSGDKFSPYEVEDATNPLNVYGSTKAEAENRINELFLENYYIFRTAWLYAPSGNNFLKTILKSYLAGNRPIKIVSDQHGNPTSCNDLAHQIIESVSAEIPSGTYHAANTGGTSWFEFAFKAFENLKLDTDTLIPISTIETENLKRPYDSRLGMAKWSTTSVSPMRDWETALKDCVDSLFESVKKENLNVN